MKKLDRTLANEPTLLAKYSYLTHNWDSISSKKKRKIWQEIIKFQNNYCVYCEQPASSADGHIEHFFHKGKNDLGDKPFAYLTFSWTNLFGCCNSQEHCGHYKDQKIAGGKHRKYNPLHLIKPDEMDPNEFLNFVISGNITVKEGLEKNKMEIATETIEALNLISPLLISSRRAQLKACSERLLALESNISLLNKKQTKIEYNSIYDEFKNGKHKTAIEQVFFS